MNTDSVFIGTKGKIGAFKLKFNDEKYHELEKHKWTQELKGAGHHIISMILTGSNGVLYAATYGHIYCIDPLDGKIRWENVPESQQAWGWIRKNKIFLAHSSELNYVYVAGSGWVVCLNGKTGDLIWETEVAGMMGKHTSETLLIAKNFILVGLNGSVHALDLKTGNLVWKNDLRLYGPVTLAYYSFQQHGTYSEESIIAGCNETLTSIDLDSGATRHTYRLTTWGYHIVSLLLDSQSNTLFAGAWGQVQALNPQSFQLKWRSDLPGMGYSHGFGLNYHEDRLYVGIRGRVACLDAKDGKMIWKEDLDGENLNLVTLTVHHHTLLAMSKGRFFGLDMKSGKTIWKDGLEGLGYGYGSVSTSYSNTNFNSTMIPGDVEREGGE